MTLPLSSMTHAKVIEKLQKLKPLVEARKAEEQKRSQIIEYCSLVRKGKTKPCGAKVLLIDLSSTVFPYTNPEQFSNGIRYAKHCPSCGFVTGYTK